MDLDEAGSPDGDEDEDGHQVLQEMEFLVGLWLAERAEKS